jgi:hypothetical protein
MFVMWPLPVNKIKSMTVLDAVAFSAKHSELCGNYRPHVLIEPAQIFSAGKKALASTWTCPRCPAGYSGDRGLRLGAD